MTGTVHMLCIESLHCCTEWWCYVWGARGGSWGF